MTSHWESTYAATTAAERSWTEELPSTSLEWIRASGIAKDARIADIGGGASRLVDVLVGEGFTRVSVVDLSASALAEAQGRVGGQATFTQSDLFAFTPSSLLDLWHDRAVLHFLSDPSERAAYVDHVAASVEVGGSVVIACFSLAGPEQCSQLPVTRASAQDLVQLFGRRFQLAQSATVDHLTPWGKSQPFTWVRFTRLDEQLDASSASAKGRRQEEVPTPKS